MVVDSSSLISLARAGLVGLLGKLPAPPTILNVVWDEVVVGGKAAQHSDASAIEQVMSAWPRFSAPAADTIDGRVLAAAVADGTLLANDLTLGRRARNLGARWLRTADLVVLLERSGLSSRNDARSAIAALWSAGRITDSLRDEYLEVLR